MTLRGLIASDSATVFLPSRSAGAEEGTEEVVTYTPVRGSNRDITVQIAGNRVSIEINEGGSEQIIERIGVHCLRNAATGIDAPRLGDTIVRYAANEPDERPYLYTGEIAWQSVDDWVLQFSRYKWTAHGDV